MRREKTTVAGEHLVAGVPLVRILDRIGIHVPPIVVPIHVHRTQHQTVLMRKTIHATTL